MRITIRQQFPTFLYLLDGEQVGTSTCSFLDSSSSGEITDVGVVSAEATGLFAWYRFRVSIDGALKYVFRKDFWDKLGDPDHDITLWAGDVLAGQSKVARFTRVREDLIKPMYYLDLADPAWLPLAMAYLPYAVANRHL